MLNKWTKPLLTSILIFKKYQNIFIIYLLLFEKKLIKLLNLILTKLPKQQLQVHRPPLKLRLVPLRSLRPRALPPTRGHRTRSLRRQRITTIRYALHDSR